MKLSTTDHTLFPLLFVFADSSSNWRKCNCVSSWVPPCVEVLTQAAAYKAHAKSLNSPLHLRNKSDFLWCHNTFQIRAKSQFIYRHQRCWPKNPHGIIPKGMYQDGIHLRAWVSLKQTCYHTDATWCQNLLPDTHTRAHNNSLCRRHLMWRSTPHKFEAKRNVSYFFFLIAWKWKGTKPFILQAVKRPSSWIRECGTDWV